MIGAVILDATIIKPAPQGMRIQGHQQNVQQGNNEGGNSNE